MACETACGRNFAYSRVEPSKGYGSAWLGWMGARGGELGRAWQLHGAHRGGVLFVGELRV